MGEAHHLLPEERVTLFKAARQALDQAGLSDSVIIAGTGANSTRATISLCKSAADAGADAVIVIPPGYFAGALARPALKTFFHDVAEASPLPVVMYNYPGAAGGLDLDSDIISEIARENANIAGVKLTCGAVGKLTRITANTGVSSFSESYPRLSPSAPEFVTLGGFADFLLPTVLGSRAHGAIMGLGNIYPYALTRLFNLARKLATDAHPDPADLQKALVLQDLASATDAAFAKAGIAGTKWFLKKTQGFPTNRVRRPLLEFSDERGAELEKDEAVIKFLQIERELASQA